jgi:hypothetical protein
LTTLTICCSIFSLLPIKQRYEINLLKVWGFLFRLALNIGYKPLINYYSAVLLKNNFKYISISLLYTPKLPSACRRVLRQRLQPPVKDIAEAKGGFKSPFQGRFRRALCNSCELFWVILKIFQKIVD